MPEPSPWLASDDDAEGWPDCLRERLVLTDSMRGLSAPETLAELVGKLQSSGSGSIYPK